MVRRQRRTCRWPVVLLEALLLQGLIVSRGYAGEPSAAPDADAASAALIAEGSDSGASLGGVDLYLDTTLNGAHVGLVHFGNRDGQLWTSKANLHQLGFVLPDSLPDPVRLDSLNGLKIDYDSVGQSVTLVAPLQLLKLDTTVVNVGNRQRPAATASPGLLLNYNVYGTYGDHGAYTLSAFNELRAFNSLGVLSTTELSQDTDSGDGTRHAHSVRMDTNFSTSFPDELLTLRVGDTLTDALSWSRSTRIGGLQFGTNFALQPYLVTAPLPSFIGSATLPSEIQLYVNGLRQYSGQIPAGPFQLNTLPNINGAGSAQVVLTNALGQTTTLNFSMYGENRLLRQGLWDWSAEAGFVRENYGIRSFDYGHDTAGSGTFRYGLTDALTVEGHAETTKGLDNAGVGGDWLLGESGGILSASYAHSDYRGQSGDQYGLGYTWSSDRLNLGVNGTRTTGNYRDIGALYGSSVPRLSAQASVSYNFDHFGALGVSYLPLDIPLQNRERYANAYWYKSLGRRLSLNLNVSQNLDQHNDRSVFVTATLALGHNITASSGVQYQNHDTGLTVNATQAVPSEGGLGWRAAASTGNGQDGGQGELDYLGRYGQVQAGLYDAGGSHYGYSGAYGSLVLMAGDVFAARQINQGFAVVSTDGVAGVPISLQNNVFGTTDRKGLLLVTPLNSYQNNKVSIDPMNLPADVSISRVDAMAVPTDRAGTLVSFGIKPVRAASITLVDAAGKPLPVGSQVRVHAQAGEPALVGFDGDVYLDTLDSHNVLDVTTPSCVCQASFDYHKQDNGIPQVGPLTCSKVSP